ncbi:MAG: hypothetical protein NTZ42_04100 [Candidatus Gribaldobacteria bacterium]|nr:hypothetical protein [Candidatus Gribaldobacteria bacterium]
MLTPIFDKLINDILASLKPHQRKCPQCGAVFDIFQEDIEFYKISKVPPPTLCPTCRLQRRLGYRINFLPTFYKKTCSAPGHNEKVISFYSQTNPIKIYDYDYWYSDKWDPLDYGWEYNFEKKFFGQWCEFILAVPNLSLYKDPKGVNSDYVVSGISPKNCYFSASPIRCENLYYSSASYDSQDCIDALQVKSSHNCYDSVYLFHCFNCFSCYECQNCLDCFFLFDCRNCQHCFGCANLRNKKYYFFNQPLSKENYEQKIKEINLGSRLVLRKCQAQFAEISQQAIKRGVYNINIERSFGDLLRNCRNCFSCFGIIGGPSENLRYIVSADKISNSMDISGGSNLSLCYESGGLSRSSKIKFSIRMRGNNLDCEYCYECGDCEYCFGCFGLKNKKFCIFNKQYSEKEYWQVVDKIKTQMLQQGEYGEFFSLSMSPFAYQDSDAQIEFPLAREEIIKNNWHWQEEVKSDIDLTKFQALKSEQVPDDISAVSNDILNVVIICQQTNKPFRIMPFELEFYRKKNLPLPTIHPLQRMKNRFVSRRHWRLWQYPCSNCGQEMCSSWDPAKKYKVYCETCYLKEVV